MNQAQYPKNEVEMIIEKIKGLGKLIILPIAILILFIAQPWVIVGPGQRGVLMRLGAVQKGVLSEGLHFKIPFVDNVVKMQMLLLKTSRSYLQSLPQTIILYLRQWTRCIRR